jgi:small conductance mechanosensitive channel
MEVLSNWFFQTGWKIVLIIGLSAGIYLLIRHFAPVAIRQTVKRQMKRRRKAEVEKRADTLIRIIKGVSAAIIIIVTLFLILQQAGVNITAALAGLGIAGVAIGFGAQWLIRDLIAGFFIFFENQYNVGDVIKAGDIFGIVEDISLRRTTLRDLDGARHVISNGEIRIMSNLTQEWARAHLDIGVAYKEDLDRVMALMRNTWQEMKQDPDWGSFMISESPVILRVNQFGDSGIIIKIVGDTRAMKQWDVMGEYRRRIKRVFDEEGIEIPWPHRKVYFGSSPQKPEAGEEKIR